MTRKSASSIRRVVALAALLVALVTAGFALASAPVASACPPQGCGHETDPDPQPHPPSTPTPTYRVTLKTIHPVQTQDATVDQVYALLKGAWVAGTANLSNLSYWNVNVTRDVKAPLYIELYDQDWDYTPWNDNPDDWMGTAYPTRPTALGASNTETFRLHGSGAVYDLTVMVTRIA